MTEVEALRGQVAALQARLDMAIVLGFLLLGGIIVWMTMRGRRLARQEQRMDAAERRLDAREGRGAAGAVVTAVQASRIRRVPRRR